MHTCLLYIDVILQDTKHSTQHHHGVLCVGLSPSLSLLLVRGGLSFISGNTIRYHQEQSDRGEE